MGRLTHVRIGVLMGGRSSERDISLKTGQAVYQALIRRGYDAVAIDVTDHLHRDLEDHKVAIAFLSLHGPGGEDGTVQGFLETLEFPIPAPACARVPWECIRLPQKRYWPHMVFHSRSEPSCGNATGRHWRRF